MPLERTSTLTVNGISGVDGNYAVPKMSTADLAGRLRRSRDSASISPLRTDRGRRLKTRAFPALPLGVRPEDVTKSGWTVVFHRDEDIAVRAALEPLIAHRLAQVEKRCSRSPTIRTTPSRAGSATSASAGETSRRRKFPTTCSSSARPAGSPTSSPRRSTRSTAWACSTFRMPPPTRRYAQSVIDYEKAATIENKKEIVYFGTRHPFDDATTLSADWLVTPLTDGLPARPPSDAVRPVASEWSFAQRKFVGDDARRQALVDVLTPADKRPPAMFFSATHGMVWPNGHERQLPAQGALLCQDWGGFGEIDARPLPGRGRRSGCGQRVRRDCVSLRVLRRRHSARGSLRSRTRRGAAGNRAEAVLGGVAEPIVDASRAEGRSPASRTSNAPGAIQSPVRRWSRRSGRSAGRSAVSCSDSRWAWPCRNSTTSAPWRRCRWPISWKRPTRDGPLTTSSSPRRGPSGTMPRGM